VRLGVKIVFYILLIFVLLAGASFAMLNSSIVTIDYWIAKKTIALSLLVVWVFVIGIVVGLLFSGWSLISARFENRKLSQKLKLIEQEVQNLRAIPFRDQH